MPSKKQILSDIRKYDASELAQAIKNGVVTLYELSKTGQLTPMLRRRIESELNRNESTPTPDVRPAQPELGNVPQAPSEAVSIGYENVPTPPPLKPALINQENKNTPSVLPPPLPQSRK